MPTPPRFDMFDDVHFVANYLLAGCEPPFDLFVEFSKEPLRDLTLLLLEPDLGDIVQNIFDPRQQRKRKPERHGTKRKRQFKVPDPGEMIGGGINGAFGTGQVFDFGPVRKVFRIVDVVDRINFTAALVEQVSDVLFSPLWSILRVEQDHCVNFYRIGRSMPEYGITGGPSPRYLPFSIDHLDFNTGMMDGVFGTNCIYGDYTVSLTATLWNDSDSENHVGGIYLDSGFGGQLAESSIVRVAPQDRVTLSVSQSFAAGDPCTWGYVTEEGFMRVGNRAVLAYMTQQIPWW